MSADWCETCGNFMLFPNSHKCPPIFMVNEPEYDEEWYKIRARSFESAAEKWADKTDAEGDYSIISGNETEVIVRNEAGEIKKFKVFGESVPEYTATEIE